MQNRHSFSYASSPVAHFSTYKPISCMPSKQSQKPRPQNPQRASGHINKANPQIVNLKTKSLRTSREQSPDGSNLPKTVNDHSVKFTTDQKDLLHNTHFFESNSKISNQSLLKATRDFRTASQKSFELSESFAKNETDLPSKDTYHKKLIRENRKSMVVGSNLKEALAKHEKERHPILIHHQDVSSPVEEVPNLISPPNQAILYSAQISPCFGTPDKNDFFSLDRTKLDQETSQKSRMNKGLQKLNSKRSATTLDSDARETNNSSFVNSQTQKNNDLMEIVNLREENRRLLEENKKKEHEYEQLVTAVELLKNERALLLSECRKAKHLYETQKLAKEEAREALKEAQKEVVNAHEAFNAKILALQRIVKNAFRGLDAFEIESPTKPKAETFQENLYNRIREMEKRFSEALREDQTNEKLVDLQGYYSPPRFTKEEDYGSKKPELESISERQEASSCNTEPSEEKAGKNEIVDTASVKPLMSYEAGLNKESELLYKAQLRVKELEHLLEERDMMYRELYSKYEKIKAEWKEKQEDNKIHVRVIEKNLDSMLEKLEKEFYEEEKRILNILEANLKIKLDDGTQDTQKKYESYLAKVDLALKACLEIIGNAKRKVEEITVSNWEIKNWLETENKMLKKSLSISLRQTDQAKNENKAFMDSIKKFLIGVEEALEALERQKQNNSKGKNNDDVFSLEDLLKKTTEWFGKLLEGGINGEIIDEENTIDRNKSNQIETGIQYPGGPLSPQNGENLIVKKMKDNKDNSGQIKKKVKPLKNSFSQDKLLEASDKIIVKSYSSTKNEKKTKLGQTSKEKESI